LDLEVVSSSDLFVTTYVEHPLLTEKTDLSDVTRIFQMDESIKDGGKKMCDFVEKPKSKVLSSFSPEVIAAILETSYINRDNPKAKKVYDILKSKLFKLPDPDNRVIHTLYSDVSSGVQYKRSHAALGLTRIFNKETKEWEFVKDEAEEEIYVKFINAQEKESISDRIEKSKYKVYGNYTNGKFEVFTGPGIMSKGIGKGRDCLSYSIKNLAKIYASVGYLDESFILDEFKNLQLEELITQIKEHAGYKILSPDTISEIKKKKISKLKEGKKEKYTSKLKRILSFLEMSTSKSEKKTGLCDSLMNFLENKNLMHA